MAYCIPKAAHFAAFNPETGAELRWNDPAGLNARWVAADLAGKSLDMIRPSAADRVRLLECCRLAGEQTGLTVRLAD